MKHHDSILKGKYPAKAHCAKVAAYLKETVKDDSPARIYLQGQRTRMIEDNDEPQPFRFEYLIARAKLHADLFHSRQRRHFFYLSGCNLPDCHLVYDIPTATLTLFIPPLDPSSVIWSGLPLSPDQALHKYDVDHVRPSSKLYDHLAPTRKRGSSAPLTFATKSHLPDDLYEQSYFVPFHLDALHNAIDESRVTKDEYEVAMLRKANEVTTAAHIAVLKNLKHKSNEQELEAVFTERRIALGCVEQAYHGIFGSGHNAATLHYVANNQHLQGRWNLLVDAAAEYECYCADVTRTIPLNGTFNAESESIYRIVQKMQEECLGMLKAAVKWEDVHIKAHEVAIEGLLDLGLLKGDKKDIFDSRTSVAFFPHGLGHYLGMDTHDTGGHPDYEDKDKMFQYLRVRGALPEGSVITVEPGVYFCRFIIEPYLKDETHKRFIDEKVLERYWDVGGVRIEDDILITKDGHENLTTAPKGTDEMKKIINSQSS